MPTDPELRDARQRAIRAMLGRSPIGSQAQLVAELRRQGIAATQSSVSRDLRDLGVARVGGRYVPHAAAAEERDPRVAEVARLLRSVRPAGPYLTVVQTAVGAAQGVARARWPATTRCFSPRRRSGTRSGWSAASRSSCGLRAVSVPPRGEPSRRPEP